MKEVEPSFAQRVGWQLRRGWLLAMALIAVAGVTVLASRVRLGPAEEVKATITGFAPEDAPRFGRGIIVLARFGDASGEADVEPFRLAGCRVGDAIAAERRGLSLVLHPMPCRH